MKRTFLLLNLVGFAFLYHSTTHGVLFVNETGENGSITLDGINYIVDGGEVGSHWIAFNISMDWPKEVIYDGTIQKIMISTEVEGENFKRKLLRKFSHEVSDFLFKRPTFKITIVLETINATRTLAIKPSLKELEELVHKEVEKELQKALPQLPHGVQNIVSDYCAPQQGQAAK